MHVTLTQAIEDITNKRFDPEKRHLFNCFIYRDSTDTASNEIAAIGHYLLCYLYYLDGDYLNAISEYHSINRDQLADKTLLYYLLKSKASTHEKSY